MKSNRIALTVLVALLACLSILPGAILAQDEPVELTFVNWIGSEEATAEDLAAMIEAFEAKHPNISINRVDLPFDQTRDQLLVMSTGGNAPDVAMVHTLWMGALAEAQVLLPLNDILPNQDDYYPSVLEGKTFGDDLLFVPWAPSPIVLYYNNALLAQAGYDAPPQTWEEMTQMAYDIAALGDDIHGIDISSVQSGGTGFYFLGTILWNFGADMLDEDGNVIIDSAESVEAFTYAQQLFSNSVIPTGLQIRDFRNLFAQGQLGFHFDGEFGVGIIEGLNEEMKFGEDFDVTLIPGPDAETAGSTFFIEHTLTIFSDTEHPEEAALFIDFLTGPEGIAIYNEFGGTKLPARQSAAEIDYYAAEENAFLTTFIDALAVARPLPSSSSAFGAAMEVIAQGVQRVAIMGDDPEAVVSDLASEIQDLYEE